MRANREASSFLSLLSLLSSLSAAISLDCKDVRVDGQHFDLSSLGGAYSVYHVRDDPLPVLNTTFTVDICKPLGRTKGVAREEECKHGTHVCGIAREVIEDNGEQKQKVVATMPIAGNYAAESGEALDPKFTRLKATDSEEEGLQLVLHGGKFQGRKQQAVIKFMCDPDLSGLEGMVDEEVNESERRRALTVREGDEGDEGEEGGKTESAKSLKFISYGKVDDQEVLRLDWYTRRACEDMEDDDGSGGNSSGHWGFFTWLIIIFFLCTAAYLIFGSWLNYNRYGARGWDLLPHGDTIRDTPYIMKDWIRRVINTVQGSGSRGGYSAV